MRTLLQRKWLLGSLLLVAVVAAAALWAFQPWKLFTRSTLHEALPAPTVQADGAMQRDGDVTAQKPTVLQAGSFVSGEHATRGSARIIELADGRRILRLENFSTSDGPDVRVTLSTGTSATQEYDPARLIELGQLKATDGNQNYAIPAGVDLGGVRDAVIWCHRFSVSFGAAELS